MTDTPPATRRVTIDREDLPPGSPIPRLLDAVGQPADLRSLLSSAAMEDLERRLRAGLDPDAAVSAAGVTLDWLTDLEDDRVLAAAGLVGQPPGEPPVPAPGPEVPTGPEQASETPPRRTLPTWALVDFFGHQHAAGLVSEEVWFGRAMMRLDIYGPVPDSPPVASQLRSPSSLFSLTWCDEQTAREDMRYYRPSPPARLALAGGPIDDPDDADPDEGRPW